MKNKVSPEELVVAFKRLHDKFVGDGKWQNELCRIIDEERRLDEATEYILKGGEEKT